MCLMICSKILSYFPTSTYDLNPKPNSDLRIIPIRRHRVSPVIATARNPNQFSLTDGISVSPRWACKLSVTHCNILGPTEICNRSHRVCLAKSQFHLLPKSVPPSFGFTLTLAHRSHRVDPVGPTETPNGHIMNQVGLTEFSESVPPSLVICV